MKHLVYFSFFVLFMLPLAGAQSNIQVKGNVYDNDSVTPIPFVFVANRNTDVGTTTDAYGHFELISRPTDTLVFNYLGYAVKKVALVDFRDSVKNNSVRFKVILQKKIMTLQQVIIMSKEFTPEEKKYYTDKVAEYERFKSQGISSPITGLYMAFSHEGKSMKKLTEMYDQMIYDELLENRLTDEKLRQVTGDDKLDCKAFRSYCRLSEEFLAVASEYDLFEAVVRLYKEYKTGKKPYRHVK